MLDVNQIRVGGFYVSEAKGLVREVWKEEGGDAYWRSYGLSDGEPVSSLVCSKYYLSRWADRGATPEEVARLRRGEADVKEARRAMQLVDIVLTNVSDEQLLAEVHRRGLKMD
jgi:hypothetical protein